MSYANKKGLVISASRGNAPPDDFRYPACVHDDLAISVSGTKADGTKDPTTRTGLIDVCAPSVSNLVTTAAFSNVSDQEYGSFGGTSAATPHVAGQAALMMGYYKNSGINLTPDDVEFLIEKSATDIGSSGFDVSTGAGRINVGNVMKMIERPKCNIFHYGTDTNPYTSDQAIFNLGGILTITLTVPYTDENGKEYPTGKYIANPYEYHFWIEHNLPAGYELSEVLPRNSNSNLFPLYTKTGQNQSNIFADLFPKGGIELIEYDQNIAHFRGYRYYLTNESCSNCSGLVPIGPDHIEYSVLACDNSTGTSVAGSASHILVYPNPVSEELFVDFSENTQDFKSVKCFNSSGQLMYEQEIDSRNSNYSMLIGDLSSGIYYLSFTGRNEVVTRKFVKQ